MSVNREGIHRFDAAATAIAREEAPSPAERGSILRARARALASEPASSGAPREGLDIVEFRLATEAYALESSYIREVLPLKNCVPLPSVPPFVVGIVNIRGRILSVVDLKIFFDLPGKEPGKSEKLVVIGDERMEFGILADAVIGARAIPLDSIEPPISTLSKIGAEYIRGIAEARLIILDARKILGDESIVIRQEGD
jgi:purine-binding chemotaxis protein CheW